MAWLEAKSKLREFIGKYGKVAIGVRCTVSFTSIAGLYVAIKNNVDVESALEKIGFGSSSAETPPITTKAELLNDAADVSDGGDVDRMEKKRNRTAEIAKSSGGALAAAVLLNKALLPVRVPITLLLTPPIARILARRSIIKNSV